MGTAVFIKPVFNPFIIDPQVESQSLVLLSVSLSFSLSCVCRVSAVLLTFADTSNSPKPS